MNDSNDHSQGNSWQNITFALSIGLLTASINPNLSLYLYERFKVDPASLSLLLGLNSVAGLIFTAAIPAISDRFSDLRPVLCLVCLGSFCGLSAIPFIAEPMMLGMLFVLLLGPYSATSSLFFSYIRRTHPSGSAVLKLRSLFSLAWVIGPASATAAMTAFGISSIFWISAALCLANSVFIWTMPPSKLLKPPPKKRSSGDDIGMISLMFCGFVLLLGTNFITGNAMALLLHQELEASIIQVGLASSLAAAVEIPLFYLLSRFSEKYGRISFFQYGCAAGFLYCVGLASAQNYLQVLLLQPFNAIFVVTVIGTGLTWFQELHPTKVGLMTGLFSNASRVSAILSAPILGATASYFSSYRGPLLAAVAMVVMGSAILIYVARKQSQQPSLSIT
ncbi:MFS transporter (plasmid) [Rhizobium leguminosarum]